MIGKRGNSNASLGVQTDQAKARRDVENSLFLAVRPIGQAAAGELPGSRAAAFSFMLTVDPKQSAGGRVKSDDRAPRSSGGVQNAVHHERRAFEFVLWPVAEIIGLDAPGNFKIIEVVGVDLVERPIASSRQVSAVGRPLGVFGSKLCGSEKRKKQNRSTRKDQQHL